MNRKIYILILLTLIPLGLGTKFYHGPFQDWIHKYAGDIFYPMFWYFLLRLIRMNFSSRVCAAIIFIFCTVVEFSQLVTTPLLQLLRRNFFGAVLLGSGFDWPDIVYYAIGVLLAVGIERRINTSLFPHSRVERP
jgi:hypothetical protein